MKIGILGTGDLAKSLGKALTHHGYHVMFGSRTPAKAQELAGEMEHFATGGTLANAIHFGEMVVLAVPYKAVEETLRASDNYRGKVLIDATNPVIPGGMFDLAMGHTTSAAEQIAAMVPDASIVKAFNTAFTESIDSPHFGPNDATMFFCGNDDKAKAAVSKMISDIGMDPVDCGPLDSARLLEPLATLIIRLGINLGMGREVAFKLLNRS